MDSPLGKSGGFDGVEEKEIQNLSFPLIRDVMGEFFECVTLLHRLQMCYTAYKSLIQFFKIGKSLFTLLSLAEPITLQRTRKFNFLIFRFVLCNRAHTEIFMNTLFI